MGIEINDLRLAAATAAQIQNTGAQKSSAPQTTQQQGAQNSGGNTAVQTLLGDTVSINIDVPKNTLDTLQKMGTVSDFLNSVATSIRQTSDGLKAASSVSNDMKASLDKIIKSDPPYSLDSKQRIAQLMEYSSLRKEIVSLMLPPPPPPIYEKVQHLWENLFSGPGNTIQTPSLAQNAPNSHIKAAAKQLDNISGQVDLLQETLSNSVHKG